MRYLLLCLVCLAALNATPSKCRISEPDYDSGNSSLSFSVAEVVMTDSATVINADIYLRPGNWVNISPDTYLYGVVTGKSYRLKGAAGINPGEETYSDSTRISPALYFEPLDRADSIFDFIEPRGWNVTGLKLYKRQSDAPVTHVTGTVDNYPECTGLMLREGEKDFRVNKTRLIPVRNGSFEFDIQTPQPIVYALSPIVEIMNGAWQSAEFFADGGDISITVTQNDMTVESESDLTRQLKEIRNRYVEFMKRFTNAHPEFQKLNEMYDSGDVYSEGFQRLIKEQQSIDESDKQRIDSISDLINGFFRNGNYLSDEGERLKKLTGELANQARNEWVDSIASFKSPAGLYNLMLNIIHSRNVQKSIDAFSTAFDGILTDHPYHRFMSEQVSYGELHPGSHYIDFSAPDLNGRMVTISDIIDGKIAVIDLWASWCGPCRRHSIGLIPIYEKYKDLGFEVVGVARETYNTKAMERAIEKDGYPWTNLVEIDDRAQIWAKYGVANAGGRIVLVGRDDKILAIDPEASQIEQILQQQLNQ